MEGEAHTSRPIEDAEGMTVDAGPDRAINYGVEPDLERETPSVKGVMMSASPMLISLLVGV